MLRSGIYESPLSSRQTASLNSSSSSPLKPINVDGFASMLFRVTDSQRHDTWGVTWMETAEVRHYATLKRKKLIDENFLKACQWTPILWLVNKKQRKIKLFSSSIKMRTSVSLDWRSPNADEADHGVSLINVRATSDLGLARESRQG